MKNDTCYYHDPQHCAGELWECQTCHESYCQAHSHVTDNGENVECVACERDRKEREVPDVTKHPHYARLSTLDQAVDRLDIKEK